MLIGNIFTLHNIMHVHDHHHSAVITHNSISAHLFGFGFVMEYYISLVNFWCCKGTVPLYVYLEVVRETLQSA